MGSQARLNLNWNGSEENLKDALKTMREEEGFSDVTLVADDGNEVKTSKVILSRGSSFFHRILRDNPHLYSHIYLVDVPYKHLQSLLDFLYTGQASIIQEDVIQFLYIADDLKIEGLILPDQPIPKTVTPLQNQISPEDHTSPPKTISTAFKNQVDADEQATQNRRYSSRTQLSAEKLAKETRLHPNAPHQPQVVAGGQATRKNVSSSQYQAPSKEHAQTKTMSPSTEATSVLQGQVSADVRTTSQPGQQFLRHISPPLSNNTLPNHKRQDDTGIVKVEVPVGDANDFNVHYVSNDQGEQYISEMTHLERVFRNNASNYQDVRGQNLAMDQDENRKIPKEEPIDTSDNCDIVHSIAVDREAGSEETIHVMYDGDAENGCKIPVEVKQNHKIKNCSVKLLNTKRGLREKACRQSRRQAKRKNMDQSECDNTVTETLYEVSTQDNTESVENMEGDKMSEEVGLDSDNEDENGFQCPFCGKLCRSASELRIHKRSHTGKKPFQCSVCFKSFSTRGNLKVHKMIHTGEKPFQCSHCPNSFSQLGNLKTHMRSHTGEKPYQCSQCPQTFSVSSNFYVHMRIHNGEKPFKCNICSKTFTQQYHLTTHKMIHTGEKPYKCLICTKNFRSSSRLAMHKRKECSS